MTKITLVQPEIAWEDPGANLISYNRIFESLAESTDIILLPELFSTGFSMRSRNLAEPMDGDTVSWMKDMSKRLGCDLAGSVIIIDNGKYFNRLIWIRKNGEQYHYDKRHLFRMSGEEENYSPGRERLIVESGGIRFLPLICYDLRFPVWSRNRNDYDALIYIANWPAPRRDVWRSLLKARAIENQAYTLGINRVGRDGMGIDYHGDTMAYNAKGEIMAELAPQQPGTLTLSLSIEELDKFRTKFPVWRDADPFSLDF
jgi:predicted amidohydrolase